MVFSGRCVPIMCQVHAKPFMISLGSPAHLRSRLDLFEHCGNQDSSSCKWQKPTTN